jgi:hypothetical protein
MKIKKNSETSLTSKGSRSMKFHYSSKLTMFNTIYSLMLSWFSAITNKMTTVRVYIFSKPEMRKTKMLLSKSGSNSVQDIMNYFMIKRRHSVFVR